MERIVLAYSGGLDTSVAIPWLKEKYNAEIIAVTMDLGQGKELEEVRDRALATGVRVSALTIEVAIVIPADGPSFGMAPSGTCTWISICR